MFFVRNIANALRSLFYVAMLLHIYSSGCSSAVRENSLTVEFKANKDATPKENGKPRSLLDILKSGVLIVCIKGPILSRNQNEISLDADDMFQKADIAFAESMAKAMGVRRLVFLAHYSSYDSVVDAIENGEGDIGISNLSYTMERSRKVQFSIPYIHEMGQTLLVDRRLLDDAEDSNLSSILNDKSITIGVETNTNYQGLVSKLFPAANLRTEDDWDREVVEDCSSGKISATILDEFRIKLLIYKNPSLLFKFVPIILTNEPDRISAIVNLDNISLLEWLNTFIMNGYTKPTADSILKKYGDHVL